MPAPVIAFLTDYGLVDAFVGICHGVIARACPPARVIDLSHDVAAHDVRAGAVVLARALPYLPDEVIVLAVVDPGVGGPRRAVAVSAADGRRFVAPDNGLLAPALQAAGGAVRAFDVGDAPVALRPVSATFHGRDVFAPVAAALAAGMAPEALGPELDVSTLAVLSLPVARVDDDGTLHAHVVAVDRFGNLELDARAVDLAALPARPGDAATVDVGGRREAVAVGRTFTDVAAGELVLYEDPQGVLALAVNRGSAAQRLAAGVDDELAIAVP